MKHSLTIALLLATLASRAEAQDARLAARLDAETRIAVERLVDSARAARLPSEPLIVKALEGASKSARGELIVRAVRTLAGNLSTARDALGASSADAEIVAGASALHAGISASALRELRGARARQPLTVPLAVLADLVARGVPRDTASAVVLALAERGARDTELVAFRRDVERDIGLGAPPATAASVRAVSGDNATAPGGVGGSLNAGGTPTLPKRRP
jgi:hypothetical protein